tara:strand:- start:78 stop:323 length:246 start_codon:yes stop_codon:yes gene_type:complete
MNDLDPHDFWLRQVLDDCQSTLIKLQSKYGKDELTLEEIDPTDLGTINMATGFINLYRLAEANQLINDPQEELSRPGVVIH